MYSVSSTPVEIQDNEIKLIEAAMKINTLSLSSSTSTVKVHASDTSVKKQDKFGSENAFNEAAIVALFEF